MSPPIKPSKPIADISLINGASGDPGVYVFFPRTGSALLFDAGNLDAMSHKDLLRVTHLLISHTHIDHFIGFDRLLRVNIPHRRRIEIVGPPGIIENVRSRILGYTWNLLEPGQITYIVHEVSWNGSLRSCALTSDQKFDPVPILNAEASALGSTASIPVSEDGARVQVTLVDHGIPSASYCYSGALTLKVRDGILDSLGLNPGPWIREVQSALKDRRPDQLVDSGNGARLAHEWASDLFEISKPKPVSYVTDLAFSWDNLHRLRSIHEGVESLVCESSFLDSDFLRARAKMHLTTRNAALIGAWCRAGSLIPFHVSAIYPGRTGEVVDQACAFFQEFRGQPDALLADHINHELSRDSR